MPSKYTPSPAWRRKQSQIDLGLKSLSAARRPGETFSYHAIARACGVTHTAIQNIERQAMHKLREKLRRELSLSYDQLAAGLDSI